MDSDIGIDYGFAAPEGLERIFDARAMTKMNRDIGINVREHIADHIGRASVSRHKCADRLGAPHSKFLEFAPAKGQLRGGSAYRPTDGRPTPFTEVRDITDTGSTVVIGNTPGLRRAFGPLTIRPKKAKALTIPIDREAYAKSARDFRNLVCITSRKGHGLLVRREDTGRGHFRPLYLLVGKSVIPQDRGLLPTRAAMQSWAEDAAEAFVEAELAALS